MGSPGSWHVFRVAAWRALSATPITARRLIPASTISADLDATWGSSRKRADSNSVSQHAISWGVTCEGWRAVPDLKRSHRLNAAQSSSVQPWLMVGLSIFGAFCLSATLTAAAAPWACLSCSWSSCRAVGRSSAVLDMVQLGTSHYSVTMLTAIDSLTYFRPNH